MTLRHTETDEAIAEEANEIYDFIEKRGLCPGCAANVLATMLSKMICRMAEDEKDIVNFCLELANHSVTAYCKEQTRVSTTH